MNRWAIRGLLFVLLIVLPALLNFSGVLPTPTAGTDIDATVTHLLASRGMPYRGARSFSGGSLKSLRFELASCAEPLQVIPTARGFEARALFDKVGRPGDVRFFAYLGKVSNEASDSWTFREHLKHRLLESLWLSPYQIDGLMLLINTPKDCDLPRLDWSLVWNKAYRRSVAQLAKSSEAGLGK